MSTLTEMTDNTRTDLNIDPGKDVWSDATIQRFINEFIGIVYAWDNQAFSETTGTITLVASTATYDLSSELTNYGKLQSLKLAGYTTLLDEVTDLDDFEDGRDLTTEGVPRWFYWYGDDTIGLYPVPDGTVATATARFNRDNPTITAGESPAWDDRWHYVCELYARWKCFEALPGYEDKAERSRQIFKNAEAVMKEDIWYRNVDNRSMANTNPGLWPDASNRALKTL